jgi:hypothetical protein
MKKLCVLMWAAFLLVSCAPGHYGVSGRQAYDVPWRWTWQPTVCQSVAADAKTVLERQGNRVYVVFWQLEEGGHVQAAVEYLPGKLRPVTHDGHTTGFWSGPSRHMGARDYGNGMARPCWGCWDHDPEKIAGLFDLGTGRTSPLTERLVVEK